MVAGLMTIPVPDLEDVELMEVDQLREELKKIIVEVREKTVEALDLVPEKACKIRAQLPQQ